MKSSIIPLSLLIWILFSCKEKEGTVNSQHQRAISSTSSKSHTQNTAVEDPWKGAYHFEASNRDNIRTSFDINIHSLNDISIYIDEDESKETYPHVQAEKLNDDKIKIVFDASLEDEMGAIFIERSDDDYIISGNPIYFINPGNDEMPLKKIK